MKLIGPLNSGAAVGNAGVATANTDSNQVISGIVRSIYVKYNDSPPAATCDVVVSTKGTSPAAPTLAIMTLTDGATDGWRHPRHQVHLSTGVATTFDGTRPLVEPVSVHDYINIKIDQANVGDNVDVWLLLSEF